MPNGRPSQRRARVAARIASRGQRLTRDGSARDIDVTVWRRRWVGGAVGPVVGWGRALRPA